MRIIAGTLGGRTFDTPHSLRTHPMSDRIRGALFNILGDLSGYTVLDAFSGSGALAMEAISRGAAHVHAIEIDRPAQNVIAENIQKLDLTTNITLIKASTNAWLQTNPDARFDLILCDPPYNDVQVNLIRKLTAHLTHEGLFVLSWPGNQEIPIFDNVEMVSKKSYGDAQLIFYRRIDKTE